MNEFYDRDIYNLRYAFCSRGARHYVYLMRDANGYYKVGYSRNVKRRAQDHSKVRKCEVEILAYRPTIQPNKIESQIFRMFHRHHVGGEWYAFSDEEYRTLLGILQEPDMPRQVNAAPEPKPKAPVYSHRSLMRVLRNLVKAAEEATQQ